jgi:hypothetical protein
LASFGSRFLAQTRAETVKVEFGVWFAIQAAFTAYAARKHVWDSEFQIVRAELQKVALGRSTIRRFQNVSANCEQISRARANAGQYHPETPVVEHKGLFDKVTFCTGQFIREQ